ncbi:lytic murein transglycosylase [Litoreibacter arenae]|uniref:Membrane-bound lytic murein transglycosylase B n=1 Tax=Litoreibacter arenae DSM 19593 TaxID=1123360 RepID=S9S0Z9_9RHOB|nr:lytic murein transglycosylase [Litoreibacter arenae]EPX79919.1 Membrane-bound lytic murein transglycosylase B precursor [Litoreibacter arenae DSM 19593]
MFNRRHFLALSGAFTLQACSAGGGVSASSAEPAMRAVPNPAFDAWVDGFKARALSQGISASTLQAGMRGVGFLPEVIERDRNQTEFKRSFEDYLAIVASEEKIAAGRVAFARQRSRLNAIEARYGVPANVVCAIWGVESNFGARRGNIPVVSSTATLAFDGRRGAFFEKQLIAALRILQSGDTTPDKLVGSWAGAMGHTQFIPTSYQLFAVDFTGDGRRDIWSEDPSDALASTAAYLAKSGWQRGQSWGREVTSGGLQPDPGGPRFAVGQNFRAIKRYNNSDNYALGVGHLADRLAGGGPLKTPFGPDKYGLTIDQRKRLQTRLTARGFDTGGADGVLGPKSQAAISAYQRSVGLEATGNPSPALLASLG